MDSVLNSLSGDEVTAIVIVLSVLLICVALPIGLAMTFQHRRKLLLARGASPEGAQAVHDLWETARRMEARIGYLEAVLDTEVPGWRSRSDVR